MALSFIDQLQYITVRIKVELFDGRLAIGTGFFFRLCEKGEKHIPVIVTNKHVIEGGKTATFKITSKNKDGTPNDLESIDFDVDNLEELFIKHPEDNVDLAVLPIASGFKQIDDMGEQIFYVSLAKKSIPTPEEEVDISAVEDILMVGYPNGIWDSVNNLPVFRKGVSATNPTKNYNGREEFMIDAACFVGSSGSPVFLYNPGSYSNKDGKTVFGNRVKLLGVLYAGPQYTASGDIEIIHVPTRDMLISKTNIPINLGNVIKAKKILDFEPLLESLAGS